MSSVHFKGQSDVKWVCPFEDIVFQFKEAGRNEAMRFVFPLSVPEGTKTGSNLNEKLKGIFDTTSTACLKDDGTIWIEAEDLIKPEDKERSKLWKLSTGKPDKSRILIVSF